MCQSCQSTELRLLLLREWRSRHRYREDLTLKMSLIEIQAKNVFFRVFASAIGEIFVFSDDFKTAFLQHSYRPDVVRCCPGEYRPIYNKVEHPIERLSR